MVIQQLPHENSGNQREPSGNQRPMTVGTQENTNSNVDTNYGKEHQPFVQNSPQYGIQGAEATSNAVANANSNLDVNRNSGTQPQPDGQKIQYQSVVQNSPDYTNFQESANTNAIISASSNANINSNLNFGEQSQPVAQAPAIQYQSVVQNSFSNSNANAISTSNSNANANANVNYGEQSQQVGQKPQYRPDLQNSPDYGKENGFRGSANANAIASSNANVNFGEQSQPVPQTFPVYNGVQNQPVVQNSAPSKETNEFSTANSNAKANANVNYGEQSQPVAQRPQYQRVMQNSPDYGKDNGYLMIPNTNAISTANSNANANSNVNFGRQYQPVGQNSPEYTGSNFKPNVNTNAGEYQQIYQNSPNHGTDIDSQKSNTNSKVYTNVNSNANSNSGVSKVTLVQQQRFPSTVPGGSYRYTIPLQQQTFQSVPENTNGIAKSPQSPKVTITYSVRPSNGYHSSSSSSNINTVSSSKAAEGRYRSVIPVNNPSYSSPGNQVSSGSIVIVAKEVSNQEPNNRRQNNDYQIYRDPLPPQPQYIPLQSQPSIPHKPQYVNYQHHHYPSLSPSPQQPQYVLQPQSTGIIIVEDKKPIQTQGKSNGIFIIVLLVGFVAMI